jgi:hypothetical protein
VIEGMLPSLFCFFFFLKIVSQSSLLVSAAAGVLGIVFSSFFLIAKISQEKIS